MELPFQPFQKLPWAPMCAKYKRGCCSSCRTYCTQNISQKESNKSSGSLFALIVYLRFKEQGFGFVAYLVISPHNSLQYCLLSFGLFGLFSQGSMQIRQQGVGWFPTTRTPWLSRCHFVFQAYFCMEITIRWLACAVCSQALGSLVWMNRRCQRAMQN